MKRKRKKTADAAESKRLVRFREEDKQLRAFFAVLAAELDGIEAEAKRIRAFRAAGLCMRSAEAEFLARREDWQRRANEAGKLKADFGRRMCGNFLAAFRMVGGRAEVEKAVFASVVFWDWFSVSVIDEPGWCAQARGDWSPVAEDAPPCDAAEIGAGLFFAGYDAQLAARRIMTYHGGRERGRTEKEMDADIAELSGESLARVREKVEEA